ncbi:MAG: hypothetical protein H7A23_13165 [Leptospiraceae bacterium]|nr:hypothetical protein [Leptospiraceae bacterium]MCP5495499.1 hypothetical protein [Leptospiraceae bacterium]
MDHFVDSIFIFLAFVTSFFFHYKFYKHEFISIQDVPNYRSMHERPTKKSAGIIFIPIFLFYIWIYLIVNNVWNVLYIYFTIGLLFWCILGFLDDKYVYHSKKKILIELLVSIPVCFYWKQEFQIFGLTFPAYIAPFLLGLYVIAVVNITNFMDGLDLYLTLTFYCAVFGLLFFFPISTHLKFTGYMLLASLLGYVYFNKPIAKLFMGDAGSLPLGFVIAIFPFLIHSGSSKDFADLAICFLFLPVFITDGIATIIKRTYAKKNILHAHREHLYQRISMDIWDKKVTTLVFSLANLPAYILYKAFSNFGFSLKVSIIFLGLIYFSLYLFVDILVSRKARY